MDGSQGDGPEADYYNFSFDFVDRMDIELDRDDDAETESHCVEEEEFLFGGDEERGSSTESSIMQNLNQPQADSTGAEEGAAIDQDADGAKQNNEESDDSDSAMGDVGVQPHPLLFPDVIRDIMNFLPASDIENCRLVRRTWNHEACTVLRSKRIVVFVTTDAVRVYNNAMRDTVDFPHSEFEFCIADFTGLVDENLREFWRIFGPHIKTLYFRQSAVYWRDLLDVIEQHVPNLEKLFFRHLPRNDVSRSRNTQNPEQRQILSVKEVCLASIPGSSLAAQERLTFLLKTLPNLESLEFLPMRPAVKTRVSMTLVDALQKPEVSLPNLKKINFNLELTSNGLDALASKGFPFQRLHLTLANGVKANAFKDLLTSLAPTLREFKVSFPDTFSNVQNFSARNTVKPEECVEVLRNLRILSMENFKGSINFVQKMPHLETLELTTPKLAQCVPFGFKSLQRGFGYSKGFPTDDHQLKYLKIFPNSSSGTAIAETLTLESISRCFPALNSIHLEGVDDDGLGVIYRNLPFLSEVELIKAKCTDQGLTGIPLEICNDMIETSTYIVVQAEKYRRDLFIGSLQFLRKFSISATDITDATIALGIADCKNLKELKIGSPKITDTGVIFVTDKFYKQLELLDLSECLEITEQSKFYAGEKLIGKLQVAETVPEDMQTAQTKPLRKETVPNPNRGIIKLKRTASATTAIAPTTNAIGSAPLLLEMAHAPTSAASASAAAAQHSKYLIEDIEFFEEHSEDELRHGFGALGGPPFPVDRNRRIFRIREAFRRNADFMRNLQRMGVQQFRRLYRREWEDRERLVILRHDEGENNPRIVERRNLGFEFDEEFDLMFLHNHRMQFPGGGGRANLEEAIAVFEPDNNNHVDDVRIVQAHELDLDSSDDEDDDPNNINRHIIIAEDDGGPMPMPPPIVAPAAGDRDAAVAVGGGVIGGGGGGGDADQPNRIPEIHFAELFRLGLRPDDIEYWLRNRPLFDREEQVAAAAEAANFQNLPAVIRAVHELDAMRNVAVAAAAGPDPNPNPNAPPPVDVQQQRDEDIDLEAIRRVVMNAFGDGEDLPDELPLER